jgi:hypothetical protein
VAVASHQGVGVAVASHQGVGVRVGIGINTAVGDGTNGGLVCPWLPPGY